MRRTFLALLVVSATGCSDEPARGPQVSLPPGDVGAGQPQDSGPPEDAASPDAVPVAPLAPGGRRVRRMTVSQLVASVPVITGGLRWTENFGQGDLDMLEVLAPTLGVPDYLLVTEENLEASMIIAKFLQDMAHRLCLAWVAQDRAAAPSERTLVQHADWDSVDAAAVRANLRQLQLRFFSRFVPEHDDGSVEALYGLFAAASAGAPAGAEARDGWLAVCIAMMTDPEMVIY